MLRRLGFALAIVALGACDDEATQLIVVVDTDLAIPSMINGVRFDVSGRGATATTTAALTSSTQLPLTLALEPEGDPGSVEIRVTGTSAGSDVVEARVDTEFLAGQRRLVNVFLSTSCISVDCTGSNTCVLGMCRPSFVAPEDLPRFDGEPGRLDGGVGVDADIGDADTPDAFDGGRDATVDAPPIDTGGVDAGCGCDDGVTCIDGVCENRLAVDVWMGQRFTCIERRDGTISCLGDNRSGQLGDGTTNDAPVLAPVDVIGFGPDGDTATDVALGFDSACVVTSGREVFCWGANEAGQLGDGTLVMRPVPQRVPGLNSIIDVSSGSNHTCTVAVSGEIQCFGGNAAGQLGDNTNDGRNTPAPVVDDLEGVQVSCGSGFTCAILMDNNVACWGGGLSGENGNSMFMNTERPDNVGGISGIPLALTTGGDNSCVAFADGTVRCWGAADFGRLGDGGASGGADQFMAVPVPALAGVTQVANGPTAPHACVNAGGDVLCWGGNRFGQVGDANVGIPRPVPFEVSLPSAAIAVETGGVSSCAVLDTGRVYCWGENARGQLGDGTTDDRGIPTEATAFFP